MKFGGGSLGRASYRRGSAGGSAWCSAALGFAVRRRIRWGPRVVCALRVIVGRVSAGTAAVAGRRTNYPARRRTDRTGHRRRPVARKQATTDKSAAATHTAQQLRAWQHGPAGQVALQREQREARRSRPGSGRADEQRLDR